MEGKTRRKIKCLFLFMGKWGIIYIRCAGKRSNFNDTEDVLYVSFSNRDVKEG